MKIEIHNAQRKKGAMARRLVYFCITIITMTLLWAVVLKTIGVYRDISVDVSDVLTFAGAAFGGELLLLCAKRILAKPTEEQEEFTDE